jgi:hypothetical protein
MNRSVKKEEYTPRKELKPVGKSGYYYFTRHHRPIMSKEYVELSYNQITKKIANMWTKMNYLEKDKWVWTTVNFYHNKFKNLQFPDSSFVVSTCFRGNIQVIGTQNLDGTVSELSPNFIRKCSEYRRRKREGKLEIDEKLNYLLTPSPQHISLDKELEEELEDSSDEELEDSSDEELEVVEGKIIEYTLPEIDDFFNSEYKLGETSELKNEFITELTSKKNLERVAQEEDPVDIKIVRESPPAGVSHVWKIIAIFLLLMWSVSVFERLLRVDGDGLYYMGINFEFCERPTTYI